MEKKKTVAVYVRKSREEETEDTLQRQQAVLVDLCERNHWNYDVYKEVGSSQELDRPELQKMISRIKLYHYDAVVSADQDRLSRNVGHLDQIKQTMVNAGCLFVTPSRVYDFRKDDDDFISDIQSVLSKQEYQKIKARLVRGSRQSARDGNWLGKKSPIGYKYNRDTKKLELSEDALVIRKMFQLYVAGLSTKDIAYKFTQEGVKTTIDMIWSPAGVTRLLSNVAYIGHSLYGKTNQKKVDGKRTVSYTDSSEQILVENTHEPIVSQELFDQVQQLKKDRNSRPPALKLGKHKFSGLIRCSQCGGIHSFQGSRYGGKRISSCQTRIYSGDSYTMCKNGGITLSKFEETFHYYFSQHVKKLERYADLIREHSSDDEPDYAQELESKLKQITKLNNDIKRIQQGFMMEIFTQSEAREQIQQIKQQIKSLEGQVRELEEEGSTTELDRVEMTLMKMRRFLAHGDKLSEREANTVLRELIDVVMYTKTDEEFNIEITMK
ncbi:Site-specific DNA recombinase [Thermoactinomyces sp. DSM 45891]|uniref:recombinase family protein n=1 Tax=Thermoactinomyces sp. DSM 45891 TaxID=1761907 RepID=UPI0009107831|nr:recombinase family protein [Thermoactinomyces sp. DSM 45891]SFX52627.1 Site-specific DNA recombinase [Thermoactinomyces sp. DSM 45891]